MVGLKDSQMSGIRESPNFSWILFSEIKPRMFFLKTQAPVFPEKFLETFRVIQVIFFSDTRWQLLTRVSPDLEIYHFFVAPYHSFIIRILLLLLFIYILFALSLI